MDIKTRDGNRKKLGGQLAANPFLWKAYIEGPLVRYKDGGGSTSFVFSSKNSKLIRLQMFSIHMLLIMTVLGCPFNSMTFMGK